MSGLHADDLKANRLFIDGEFVTGDTPFAVINPATEQPIGEIGAASPAHIEAAIGAARRAFDSGVWSDLGRAERCQAVSRLLDHLEANTERLRRIIVAEAGCPIGIPAMATQVDKTIRQTRQLIDLYLTLPEFEQNPVPILERVSPSGAFMESLRRYVPVGVVSAISAYNFPLFLNLWKVIPSLITGNTVILRPSPLTPYSALIFGEAAVAAGLPRGVINVVVDPGHEGGVTMTRHPSVDMVTFTGSSAVGEMVAAQAAKGLKRLQLELGGKSAQIFLPDRLDAVGSAAVGVCTSHSGQGCVLGTRILVPAEHKQELMAKIAAPLAALVVGDPTDSKTQMGPVISAAQRDRCERYVAEAVAAGGKVVTGGQRPAGLDRGYYFQPTVLDLPDNSNPAAQDEIFGPVVGVIGYDSIDHAVQIANDTVFGLSGYVFGRDMKQALSVAMRLRTGTVNVNGTGQSAFGSSGGFGLSGIGRERGIEGIRGCQQIQALNITN